MLARTFRAAEWALWFGLVVLLPFTSLPLMRAVFGSAMVAPPSALPLLGLMALFLLPTLARGGKLPPQSRPLIAFAAAALISSLAAYFIPFPIFLQVNFTRHMIEAGLTLGVGVCFYLISATWPSDEPRLRATLRWINWSGLVILAWAFFQGSVTRINYYYPGWMDDLQAIFSSSQLFWSRATGFAYEPSWLAHQLNMLYLPLWLAATVRRHTVHRIRLLGITFENILLVGGFVVLWLTISRVGLLAFLLTVAYLLMLGNLWLVNWLQNSFLPGFRKKERTNRTPDDVQIENALTPSNQVAQVEIARSHRAHGILRIQIIILIVIIYTALFAGTALLMRQLDKRMQKMFDFTTIAEKGFLEYANQLLFAERIVYWQVGWEVFNDHPWLGVGLGNAGYFLPEKLSSFGWGLPDLKLLMYRDSGVPNTKSLWSRLLADTGLVGFGLFITWLLISFLTGRSLDKQPDRLRRTLGLAAQLAAVALILEGFSLDTFALPYYWMIFGLASAAWKNPSPA